MEVGEWCGTDYEALDELREKELTPRQKTILRNRIEKNRLVVRARYGKRKYDKLAKIVDKVLNKK